MARRQCCTEPPCHNKSGGYPYGFTVSGTHSTLCGSWWTPDSQPDWSVTTQQYLTIIMLGQSLKIDHIGGTGAPQPYSCMLANPASLPWNLTLTTSGTCKQSGLVFTPNTTPTDWVANILTGKHVTIGGTSYMIASNTTSTFTLTNTPTGSAPHSTASISFTYYQYPSGSFTMASGVCTPATPPVGWGTNQLVGYSLQINDNNNNAYRKCPIIANTATSVTLSNPPADGVYTNYKWWIQNATTTDSPAIAVTTIPVQPDKLQVFQSALPNWITNCFVGCNVVYGNSTAGVVTANDATTLTVTNANTSAVFGDLTYSIPLTMSGNGWSWCDKTIETGITQWTGMAGAKIVINSADYAIVSNASSALTVDKAITYDSSWRLNTYDSGQYFDVVNSGLATTKDAGCDYGYCYCAGYSGTGDTVVSNANGAKILWNAGLLFNQYYLTCKPLAAPSNGKMKLYFGPDGDSYFETPVTGASGTSTLNVCGHVVAFSQNVNPDSMQVTNQTPPKICIWSDANGYHVIATPSGYLIANSYNRYYYPLSLEYTIDKATWEAKPHKVGVGIDAGGQLCSLLMWETKTTAEYPNPADCLYCTGVYLPNWTGTLPSIRLIITGGTLAGTYILTYRYGGNCWAIYPPPYNAGFSVTITTNRDDTIDLGLIVSVGGGYSICGPQNAATGTASGTAHFAAGVWSGNLTGPFYTGITAVSVEFIS